MRGQRLLIALDDNSEAVRDCCHVLELAGFEVAVAHDGLECVSQLRESAPDLLLIDPDLPWGGGDGVLAIMCADPELAKIPVVAVSGHPGSASWRRLTPFPVRAYLRMPLSADLLVKLLGSILPARREAADEPVHGFVAVGG